MARHRTTRNKQRAYAGKVLVTTGLMAMAVDLSLVAKPILEFASRLKEGLFGIVPSLGMCLLNATHALAFHQLDYFSVFSRILVLSCAVVSLIAGLALLRPKAKRPLVFELVLAPELEGRETINNGSR